MLDVNMSKCQDAKVSHSNMTWGMQFALNRDTGISFWQTRSFCSWEMVFSDSDRTMIEVCFREKGWCGARIVKEFPGKKWSRQSIKRLLKKIEDTGSTSRESGSGRPRTACTDENKDNVEDMIQSQEDLPATHHPQRIIACELGVSQSSVSRLAHKLKLKAYKWIRVSRRDEKVRNKRKMRCRLLLNRFTAEKVKNIIFTDEKDFTLEVARNRQNDQVYGKRKRDIAPNRLYHETSNLPKRLWYLLEFLGKEKPGFTLSIWNILKWTVRATKTCWI